MLLAGGFNVGDMLFQLIVFLIVIAIPITIVLVVRSRTSRLKRIEEKIDKILSEKGNLGKE